MTLEQLQNALNQQTAETNAVRELLIAIKGFGSGEVSIEKVVKVYKDNRILLDDAVEKYLTGSSPIVYVTQRGGFKLSKEHKQKISQALKGRRMTEEEKERHRENARCKQVYQYTEDWNLVYQWASTREAEREGGYNNSNISRACRTGRKAYNFYWRYRPIGELNEVVRIETETTIRKR